jgi:tellurite resistance protein TerC
MKLILHWAHEDVSASVPEISTAVSLGVIVVLAIVTVASLIKTRNDPTAKAHPGALRPRRVRAEQPQA